MFKNAAKNSALFLALIVAAIAPAARIHAQAPDEPRPLSMPIVLVPYLIYLA